MPYVVSEFSSHSLIPTIAIVSNILSGVLKLPVAKIIDSWGRPQGFASTTLLAALGLLLMSLCRDVETYAAAQVCAIRTFSLKPMSPNADRCFIGYLFGGD